MGMGYGLGELTPFLDESGRLSAFPAKHKKKLLALWYLAGKIEGGRQYSEPEINDLLDEWTLFHDPATLRRELYNKRLVDRTTDCCSSCRCSAVTGPRSPADRMRDRMMPDKKQQI